MKLYIAGPMSGYGDFNFHTFHQAAHILELLGHVSLNPAAKESMPGSWFPDWAMIPETFTCPSGSGTAKDPQFAPGQIHSRDFEMILEADGIAMLPGWQRSRGARAELLVAQLCEKSIWQFYGGQLEELYVEEIQTWGRDEDGEVYP